MQSCTSPIFNKLPNPLRERLLQQARGHGLLVYEFVIKIMGSAPFTISQLMDKMSAFGLEITRRTIDYGLSDTGLFVQTDVLRDGVGRPAQVFRARPLHLVLESCGVERSSLSDALCASDLKNLPAYRLALHRAMILRQQEKKTVRHGRYMYRQGMTKFTRGWEALRLGVDKNTIRRYDKRAGVEHMEDIRFEELYFADNLPEKKADHCTWLVQFGKRFPAVEQIAEKLLSLGKVMLAKQYANYYWIPT